MISTPEHPTNSVFLTQSRLHLSTRFDVVEKDISVAGRAFVLLGVRDTNALVDAIDPKTFAEDERVPYWADLWTSSLELARWCLEDADIRGKRVLELGCGLGLSGIAAAAAGAIVTLSDYESDALDFARYNTAANLPEEIVSTRVSFLLLDWRSLPAVDPFDVLIAADVVYERRNFLPMIDVLTTLLTPKGFAVFTEPGRSIGELFFALLREQGFHLTVTKHCVELNRKTSEVTRAIITLPESGTDNS